MSRKGNCLDNACVEGFFGHLKDEFYRGQEWPTFEGFRRDLEAYLAHWNLVRRQAALMCLPPVEFPAAHGDGMGLVFNVSKAWGAVHPALRGFVLLQIYVPKQWSKLFDTSFGLFAWRVVVGA